MLIKSCFNFSQALVERLNEFLLGDFSGEQEFHLILVYITVIYNFVLILVLSNFIFCCTYDPLINVTSLQNYIL